MEFFISHLLYTNFVYHPFMRLNISESHLFVHMIGVEHTLLFCCVNLYYI